MSFSRIGGGRPPARCVSPGGMTGYAREPSLGSEDLRWRAPPEESGEVAMLSRCLPHTHAGEPMIDSDGFGRELFAMFRQGAGGAEQGGSAMLELAGL
jgi:hypothetical protein